ncbi:hypothetical protein LINPERHAP2_LOCUS7405 [Linum perenne]
MKSSVILLISFSLSSSDPFVSSPPIPSFLHFLPPIQTKRSKRFSQEATQTTSGFPQLKGARCFSFDELKKYTSNFSDNNGIGSGGYNKVKQTILNFIEFLHMLIYKYVPKVISYRVQRLITRIGIGE